MARASFMALAIPGFSERQTNYNAYLPATTNHPNALGMFITPPSLAQPGQVDLGLWNVYANPDMPCAPSQPASDYAATHGHPADIAAILRHGDDWEQSRF